MHSARINSKPNPYDLLTIEDEDNDEKSTSNKVKEIATNKLSPSNETPPTASKPVIPLPLKSLIIMPRQTAQTPTSNTYKGEFEPLFVSLEDLSFFKPGLEIRGHYLSKRDETNISTLFNFDIDTKNNPGIERLKDEVAKHLEMRLKIFNEVIYIIDHQKNAICDLGIDKINFNKNLEAQEYYMKALNSSQSLQMISCRFERAHISFFHRIPFVLTNGKVMQLNAILKFKEKEISLNNLLNVTNGVPKFINTIIDAFLELEMRPILQNLMTSVLFDNMTAQAAIDSAKTTLESLLTDLSKNQMGKHHLDLERKRSDDILEALKTLPEKSSNPGERTEGLFTPTKSEFKEILDYLQKVL